jgi:hypothetical protein
MSGPLSQVYLTEEGDSLQIVNYANHPSTISEQTEALACKTHKEVLDLLNKIKNSGKTDQFEFYHYHNTCYDNHMCGWPNGQVHPCPLDTQISFVTYKILEQQHGVRHAPKPVKNPKMN